MFRNFFVEILDQSACAPGRDRQLPEILILADHDLSVCLRLTPDHRVVCLLQSQFPHMLGIVSLALEKPRQRWRQLMINQKFQAGWSTT